MISPSKWWWYCHFAHEETAANAGKASQSQLTICVAIKKHCNKVFLSQVYLVWITPKEVSSTKV